jgi:hypothetical protein
MSLQLLLVIILAIMIIPIIKNHLDRKKNDKVIKEDAIEMEKVFFERIQNGSSAIRIANIYGQLDTMLIKSVLQSEQIPYYIEFENISRLRTGFALGDYYKSFLNVLEEDYNDAIKMLIEYKKNKKRDYENASNDLRKTTEVLVAGHIVPSAEDDSIEIIQKKY